MTTLPESGARPNGSSQGTEAVRSALLDARFRHAEVGGRPVRQLVSQSFTFRLSN